MSLLNELNTDVVEAQEVIAPSQQLNPKNDKAQEPSWWWDDNTPGVGDRPDYLTDKYKNVAEAAKARLELEKKLGQAPKEYDFSKARGWMDEDYEPFQEMAEFAKQNHVSQEVMDRVLDSVGLYLEEFKPDLDEEKAKLGENASQRLEVLNNWAKSNLSKQSFEVLSGAMRTAEAIEAMEELRAKMESSTSMIPGNNDSANITSTTLEEYRSELNSNYEKYKTDPHYRKQMERKLEGIMSVKK